MSTYWELDDSDKWWEIGRNGWAAGVVNDGKNRWVVAVYDKVALFGESLTREQTWQVVNRLGDGSARPGTYATFDDFLAAHGGAE